MPSIDYPLEKLLEYRPPLTARPDFDEFWKRTLSEARAVDLNPLIEPVDYPIKSLHVNRLSYAGYGGDRIKGLYILPDKADGKLPPVIVYHGYSGGAGQVHLHLPWLLMGCAVIAVDTRGQGGETGDPAGYHDGTIGGWMTQGLTDPDDYYYRRAYTDCVRAVDFAASRDELDLTKLTITGGSQGGGLSLAVAGLEPRVKFTMADVPFLCHFGRATDIAANGPYQELQRYFAKYPDRVELGYATLSYFDGMNLASRTQSQGRMLWSVALWDDVCPPSTVFAAYHHCPVPIDEDRKQIAIYPYNKHEGGGGIHKERQIAWLSNALRLPL